MTKIYTGGNGCGSNWGDLLGAGFGGFLGAAIGNGGLFGNNRNGDAAAVAAANQGTDSISRQVLAGQQEAQLQTSIAGVNGRIDGLSGQIQANANLAQLLNGFGTINANIGDLAGNVNDFARQMCDCCCQTKTAILEQGYQNQLANCQQTNTILQGNQGLQNTIQNGFTNLGYQNERQACDIKEASLANTQRIIDTLNAHWSLEQQTTIQQLRDELGRQNQTQALEAFILANKTATT